MSFNQRFLKITKHFVNFLTWYLFGLLIVFVMPHGGGEFGSPIVLLFLPLFALIDYGIEVITGTNIYDNIIWSLIGIIDLSQVSTILVSKFIEYKFHKRNCKISTSIFFISAILIVIAYKGYYVGKDYYYNDFINYDSLSDQAVKESSPQLCAHYKPFRYDICLNLAALKSGNKMFCNAENEQKHPFFDDLGSKNICLTNLEMSQALSKNICKNDRYDFSCTIKYCSAHLDDLTLCFIDQAKKTSDEKWCNMEFVSYTETTTEQEKMKLYNETCNSYFNNKNK